MDQAVLVSSGHALVRAMDTAGISPRLAMWVHYPDTERWKLWIVPPVELKDRHEFYRRLAELIAKNRTALGDLSASDVEFAKDDHPGVKGIARMMYAPRLSSLHFTGNRFDGYYLPDGVLLRSQFERRSVPRS